MSTRPAPSVRSLPSANSSGTKLARPAGFGPTTLGFGGQYSNPLSYGRLEGRAGAPLSITGSTRARAKISAFPNKIRRGDSRFPVVVHQGPATAHRGRGP